MWTQWQDVLWAHCTQVKQIFTFTRQKLYTHIIQCNLLVMVFLTVTNSEINQISRKCPNWYIANDFQTNHFGLDDYNTFRHRIGFCNAKNQIIYALHHWSSAFFIVAIFFTPKQLFFSPLACILDFVVILLICWIIYFQRLICIWNEIVESHSDNSNNSGIYILLKWLWWKRAASENLY